MNIKLVPIIKKPDIVITMSYEEARSLYTTLSAGINGHRYELYIALHKILQKEKP